jgi:hypothetical protein
MLLIDKGVFVAYHVTLMSNLVSILDSGLIPQIGENSKELGETEDRVYAFIDKDSTENALLNWLGEIYEDMEVDLVILEVDDSHFDFIFDSNGDVFFECYAYSKIPPSAIIKVISEEEWSMSLL